MIKKVERGEAKPTDFRYNFVFNLNEIFVLDLWKVYVYGKKGN